MDLDIEISNGLEDKFGETVDHFMESALAKEKELSVSQVSSSFLYTSACYSAHYYIMKSAEENIDLEEFINEHVEFFANSLRSSIEHYASEGNANS